MKRRLETESAAPREDCRTIMVVMAAQWDSGSLKMRATRRATVAPTAVRAACSRDWRSKRTGGGAASWVMGWDMGDSSGGIVKLWGKIEIRDLKFEIGKAKLDARKREIGKWKFENGKAKRGRTESPPLQNRGEERFLTSAGRRIRRSESGRRSRPAPFGMTGWVGLRRRGRTESPPLHRTSIERRRPTTAAPPSRRGQE